jgi:fatty-acyl-CoA synthase
MNDPSPPVLPSTLSELLISRAAADNDRLAVAERGDSLTFGELLAQASAVAAGLAAHGVRQGDRVVLCLPAGLGFVRAFWGAQLLGAVTCALNPAAPPVTTVRRASRVRPRLLITMDQTLVDEARRGGIEVLSQVPRSSSPVQFSGASGGDIAVLQTTSGTSGESRAAMITHRNIMSAVGFGAVLGLSRDSIFVSWAPPWHDLGLIRFVISSVYTGAQCHIVQPAIQTIPEWLATIDRVRATSTGAPDFAYRLAARLVDPSRIDLSSLRQARSGGEPVRLSTIRMFERTFELSGVTEPGYGLAEATLGVTCVRPGEPLRVDDRGNVSCGTALPEVELRIDAASGEAGEILVRGPIVFAGYFDDDEATREILRDGWLHTGDIGRLDADGHLYVLGRKRAMLKRGGAVIAPRELEEAAQAAGGVRMAAAVSLPPSEGETTESIVVVIEPADPSQATAIAAAVARAVRDAVGFTPENVLAVKARTIPITSNGKIRHDALRAQLIDGAFPASAILFSARSARGSRA